MTPSNWAAGLFRCLSEHRAQTCHCFTYSLSLTDKNRSCHPLSGCSPWPCTQLPRSQLKNTRKVAHSLYRCQHSPGAFQSPDTAADGRQDLPTVKWNLRTLLIPSAFSCRMTGARLLRLASQGQDWGSWSKASFWGIGNQNCLGSTVTIKCDHSAKETLLSL